MNEPPVTEKKCSKDLLSLVGDDLVNDMFSNFAETRTVWGWKKPFVLHTTTVFFFTFTFFTSLKERSLYENVIQVGSKWVKKTDNNMKIHLKFFFPSHNNILSYQNKFKQNPLSKLELDKNVYKNASFMCMCVFWKRPVLVTSCLSIFWANMITGHNCLVHDSAHTYSLYIYFFVNSQHS